MGQVLSVIWESEMSDSHDTYVSPGEAVQRASGTRRKMVGLRVDCLGWINGKAPLRPRHLVARREWKETNCADFNCRAVSGKRGQLVWRLCGRSKLAMALEEKKPDHCL